jgi:hypothetical protein
VSLCLRLLLGDGLLLIDGLPIDLGGDFLRLLLSVGIRYGDEPLLIDGRTLGQGLTLVHYSAQLKRFPYRIGGVRRGCVARAQGALGGC